MTEPHEIQTPAEWVVRWAPLVRAGSRVLDVASGRGRHARFFASRGCQVLAVDCDAGALAALREFPGITVCEADLEAAAWPFTSAAFDAVVVTNYLHRPTLSDLIAALAPGGVLIYETFMIGNERFGKPSNPAFLLAPQELLDVVQGRLEVLAFEQGQVARPKPAVIQRLCAVRGTAADVSLPVLVLRPGGIGT
jgi:SAM-dependent methyltransferase